MKIPDKILLFVALLVSFFGVLGLFFVYLFFEVPLVEIDDARLDRTVRLRGYIWNSSVGDSVSSFWLEHECRVLVVDFENHAIDEGAYAEVVGEVVWYKGKKEVVLTGLKYVE